MSFMDEEEKLKIGDDRDQNGGGRRRFWREMPIYTAFELV